MRFSHPGASALDLRRVLQCGCGFGAEAPQGEAAAGVEFHEKDSARQAIRKVLPFHPTSAQKRVLKEIVDDMCSARPMNRLLQGDVGSGKTIVAIQAAHPGD